MEQEDLLDLITPRQLPWVIVYLVQTAALIFIGPYDLSLLLLSGLGEVLLWYHLQYCFVLKSQASSGKVHRIARVSHFWANGFHRLSVLKKLVPMGELRASGVRQSKIYNCHSLEGDGRGGEWYLPNLDTHKLFIQSQISTAFAKSLEVSFKLHLFRCKVLHVLVSDSP